MTVILTLRYTKLVKSSEGSNIARQNVGGWLRNSIGDTWALQKSGNQMSTSIQHKCVGWPHKMMLHDTRSVYRATSF